MKKGIEEQTYKSIKIPQWAYENLEQAKLALSRKGIEKLPKEVLSPEYCPICKTNMEELKLEYLYKRCPNCGYRQQEFKASSNFFRGALVGLGLSLFIYLIFKK